MAESEPTVEQKILTLKKNDTVTLSITGMTAEGMGTRRQDPGKDRKGGEKLRLRQASGAALPFS